MNVLKHSSFFLWRYELVFLKLLLF